MRKNGKILSMRAFLATKSGKLALVDAMYQNLEEKKVKPRTRLEKLHDIILKKDGPKK